MAKCMPRNDNLIHAIKSIVPLLILVPLSTWLLILLYCIGKAFYTKKLQRNPTNWLILNIFFINFLTVTFVNLLRNLTYLCNWGTEKMCIGTVKLIKYFGYLNMSMMLIIAIYSKHRIMNSIIYDKNKCYKIVKITTLVMYIASGGLLLVDHFIGVAIDSKGMRRIIISDDIKFEIDQNEEKIDYLSSDNNVNKINFNDSDSIEKNKKPYSNYQETVDYNSNSNEKQFTIEIDEKPMFLLQLDDNIFGKDIVINPPIMYRNPQTENNEYIAECRFTRFENPYKEIFFILVFQIAPIIAIIILHTQSYVYLNYKSKIFDRKYTYFGERIYFSTGSLFPLVNNASADGVNGQKFPTSVTYSTVLTTSVSKDDKQRKKERNENNNEYNPPNKQKPAIISYREQCRRDDHFERIERYRFKMNLPGDYGEKAIFTSSDLDRKGNYHALYTKGRMFTFLHDRNDLGELIDSSYMNKETKWNKWSNRPFFIDSNELTTYSPASTSVSPVEHYSFEKYIAPERPIIKYSYVENSSDESSISFHSPTEIIYNDFLTVILGKLNNEKEFQSSRKLMKTENGLDESEKNENNQAVDSNEKCDYKDGIIDNKEKCNCSNKKGGIKNNNCNCKQIKNHYCLYKKRGINKKCECFKIFGLTDEIPGKKLGFKEKYSKWKDRKLDLKDRKCDWENVIQEFIDQYSVELNESYTDENIFTILENSRKNYYNDNKMKMDMNKPFNGENSQYKRENMLFEVSSSDEPNIHADKNKLKDVYKCEDAARNGNEQECTKNDDDDNIKSIEIIKECSIKQGNIQNSHSICNSQPNMDEYDQLKNGESNLDAFLYSIHNQNHWLNRIYYQTFIFEYAQLNDCYFSRFFYRMTELKLFQEYENSKILIYNYRNMNDKPSFNRYPDSSHYDSFEYTSISITNDLQFLSHVGFLIVNFYDEFLNSIKDCDYCGRNNEISENNDVFLDQIINRCPLSMQTELARYAKQDVENDNDEIILNDFDAIYMNKVNFSHMQNNSSLIWCDISEIGNNINSSPDTDIHTLADTNTIVESDTKKIPKYKTHYNDISNNHIHKDGHVLESIETINTFTQTTELVDLGSYNGVINSMSVSSPCSSNYRIVNSHYSENEKFSNDLNFINGTAELEVINAPITIINGTNIVNSMTNNPPTRRDSNIDSIGNENNNINHDNEDDNHKENYNWWPKICCQQTFFGVSMKLKWLKLLTHLEGKVSKNIKNDKRPATIASLQVRANNILNLKNDIYQARKVRRQIVSKNMASRRFLYNTLLITASYVLFVFPIMLIDLVQMIFIANGNFSDSYIDYTTDQISNFDQRFEDAIYVAVFLSYLHPVAQTIVFLLINNNLKRVAHC